MRGVTRRSHPRLPSCDTCEPTGVRRQPWVEDPNVRTPYENGVMRKKRPLMRAYIDETGDRGTGGKSSPFFAFAAVLVADEDEPELRTAVSKLRRDFKVPVHKPLHWNQHVKTFSRRQHATATLSAVDAITVLYVGVEKAAIPLSARMRTDQEAFYNFAAGMVLERVLLQASHWPGSARDAVVRFGHVRGFNHQTTKEYLELRAHRGQPAWVPWGLLRGPVHFDDQASWDGLQAADQYAGMLSTALRADEFGNFQPHHLINVRHQLREVNGKCWTYGFKWLGNQGTLHALPWWDQFDMR